MKIALFALVAVVSVAAVTAIDCHGDDGRACTGYTCTAPNTVAGCEHDVCTCVPGMTCSDISGCATFSCHHEHSPHCVDNKCACLKDEHHGPPH